ncbi:unnamed protein product, partial [Mesorhabditis spiculigera]
PEKDGERRRGGEEELRLTLSPKSLMSRKCGEHQQCEVPGDAVAASRNADIRSRRRG